ncbi:MAG: FUSC family protein [Myxococcota bacterium]|jgi:hypothetical protein
MKTHVLIAFKTAVAALLALRISMWLGLSHPYWSAFTVFVLMTPFFGASIEKGVMRLAGTAAGCILGMLIAVVSTGHPAVLIACVFLCALFAAYMGTGPRFPYAATLCGVTAMMVALPSIERPDAAFAIAWARTAEIATGIIIALLFDLALRTRTAADEFSIVLKKMIADAAGLVAVFAAFGTSGTPPETNVEKEWIRRKMLSEFPRLRTLLNLAVYDSGRIRARRQDYAAAIGNLEDIFITITGLEMNRAFTGPASFNANMRAELGAAIGSRKAAFDAVAGGDLGGGPVEELGRALKAVEQKFEQLRADRVPRGYSPEEVAQASAFFEELCALSAGLDRLRLNLADPGGASGTRAAAGRAVQGTANRTWRSKRIRHALKGALAALAATGAWFWWDRAAGVSAVVTVMIVMLATPGQADKKSILRLAGCALGGLVVLAIQALHFSSLDSWPAFVICFFPAFMLFGFIQSGSPKYSYAGLQAALALALTMGDGGSGGMSASPVLERFLGIVLGVVIVAIVHRVLWPVQPVRELRERIAVFWRDCNGWLAEMRSVPAGGPVASMPVGAFESGAKEGPRVCLEWIGEINEDRFVRESRPAALEVAGCLQSMVFRMQALKRALSNPDAAALCGLIDGRLRALDAAFSEMFGYLERGAVEVAGRGPPPDLGAPAGALDAQILEIRRNNITVGRPVREVTAYVSVTARYRDLVAGLSEAGALAGRFGGFN